MFCAVLAGKEVPKVLGCVRDKCATKCKRGTADCNACLMECVGECTSKFDFNL